MTSEAPPATATNDGPDWRLVLRALRETRGVTQDGWAGRLGVSRRTVQRWERGDLVPDAAMEAAIVALCRERATFRTVARGPLAGLALSAELLGDVLAAARLGHRDSRPSADDREGAAGGAALPAGRSNLPAPRTRFIGRRAEIAEVTRLLGESRLLTLAGTGGCGKTRLACEVARSLAARYPDGAWFVELAAVADPALVPATVAAALGVREERGRPLLDALAAFLRPRRLLLVLDNCEHLLEACARLADALLSDCPDLTVLATSRARLAIDGETVWRVPSMAVSAFGVRRSALETSSDSAVNAERRTPNAELPDAVRLFVERARTMRPDFELTDANAGAVTQICRRLDGIPLAIELAAVRLNVLSVDGIAARLDDRFRLLNAGSRATLPRHQTLRSLIDWSYDLLDERDRRLFERLAVFAGGFDLAAAEAVCGDEAYLLDPLAELADRSLVIVEQRGDEARYRLLETLRQYAQERLAARGELTALQRRHRDHFLALAEEAEPDLRGPEQAVRLERLAEDQDNLRAALDLCAREPDGAEAGLRLAASLLRLWEVRGLLAEGRGRLERMLAAGADAAPTLRARALNAAGTLAYQQGDYPAAGRFHEQALAIARSAGDGADAAWALVNLGLVRANLGDDEAAAGLIEEGLALRRTLGDRRETAKALFNLGYVAHRRGDVDRARALYEEYLAAMRELGNDEAIAGTLSNLGYLALMRNEPAHAQTLFEESLAIRRRLADERGAVFALRGLGGAAYDAGDHALAAARLAECLRIAHRLGMQRHVSQCLDGLGVVAVAAGRYARAGRLLGAGEALRESLAIILSPIERESHERTVVTLRDALDDATLAASWADGKAMPVERAVELALGEPASPQD